MGKDADAPSFSSCTLLFVSVMERLWGMTNLDIIHYNGVRERPSEGEMGVKDSNGGQAGNNTERDCPNT